MVGMLTESENNVGHCSEAVEKVGLHSRLNSSSIILNTNRNHGDHHRRKNTDEGCTVLAIAHIP